MAFRVRAKESIGHGLRRLAKKQLSSACEHLQGTLAKAPGETAIHAARKSVKKVRAIVELVEHDNGHGMAKSRKRLRDANRILSRSRDADAMNETFATLLHRQPRVLSEHTEARLRRRLADHKDVLARSAADNATWKEVVDELRSIRKVVKRWSHSHEGFGSLAPGLRSTHKRGRKAMALALERWRADDFHEWRKQIKALWYELRLIEAANTTIARKVKALGQSETALGDDHNIAVLCDFVSDSRAASADGNGLRQFVRSAADYQEKLRRAAIASAEAIYAMPTRDFVRQLKKAWRTRARGHRVSRSAGTTRRAQRS